MSKRLSDTEIWKKSWFYELDQKYKLFWFYILSDCDAAGVWSVNLKLANNILGYKLDHDDILNTFKEQICVLNSGKYWIIVDFIKFQYGYPLSENSKMRKKLIELLYLRGLNLDTLYEEINAVSIQYQYSINTVKDKDKDIKGGVGENVAFDPFIDLGWSKNENQYKGLLESYPKLFQFKYSLKFEEHQKLLKKYTPESVEIIYNEMQNYKDLLKKSESAYLTATNWLNRKKK